jgi:hypothetical protein
VLRMLVVVLRGNPIVASRCFLPQGEVTLINLGGVAADPLSRAVTVERLIVLPPSWLLTERPVFNKATARRLIRSHDARRVGGPMRDAPLFFIIGVA